MYGRGKNNLITNWRIIMKEYKIPKGLLIKRGNVENRRLKALKEFEYRSDLLHEVDVEIFSARYGLNIGTPVYYTTNCREITWGVVVGFIWKTRIYCNVVIAIIDTEHNITPNICIAAKRPDKLRKSQWRKINGIFEYQLALHLESPQELGGIEFDRKTQVECFGCNKIYTVWTNDNGDFGMDGSECYCDHEVGVDVINNIINPGALTAEVI